MVSAQRRTPSLTTCLWAPLVLIFYSAHCGRSCPGVWERAQELVRRREAARGHQAAGTDQANARKQQDDKRWTVLQETQL
ncbi:hypothetical protein Cadr_000013983 [Camelus dromedarius]|uniref:Secreted protein n=1 Tax=Camelus dromedarius TaxID=9838 RepID=A0A5N4DBS3_CAMDR|nr:hypothetical protein Cadr_000013983 [Camelus dromedarius]